MLSSYRGISVYSKWQHIKSGNIYTVVLITNLDSTKESYPPTICYQGEDGKLWSCPISKFENSMTLLR